MYLDAQLRFSDDQIVTADAVGTNSIDLGLARAMSNGDPIAAVFTVTTAADQGTGDEDYTFEVETSTNAAQSTGRQLLGRRVFQSGTPTAPAQDADLLVAGFKVVIQIPTQTLDEAARYIGVRYDVTGTTPSITCSCQLMPVSMIETSGVQYNNGYNIT